VYLRQDFPARGPLDIYICKVISVPVHGQSYRSPTNKIGMMADLDFNGPEISTGRGILRKVCIGLWTEYDSTSQSKHFLYHAKKVVMSGKLSSRIEIHDPIPRTKLYESGIEGQLRH
jgi:hypothetical protein